MFQNHVDLIGFIGSDPETRQLENAASMTYFSLATKTTWRNEGGSYDSRTEWHRIVVWGKLAQFAAGLTKGAHIEIEGWLRYRTYQKEVPIGKKNIAVDMTTTEIHASAIRKLDHNHATAMPIFFIVKKCGRRW
jgi:single-strand DNA-binding protein